MSRLADLKKKRDELNKQIAIKERSEGDALKAAVLAMSYTKVACLRCDGIGEVRDINNESEWDCDDCSGRGFLYARKWEAKKQHDLDYNEVAAP